MGLDKITHESTPQQCKENDVILLATINKSATLHIDSATKYESNMVSYDREALIEEIEQRYNLKLVKKDADDFPWFSDGGFKYQAMNDQWFFEITCYPMNILKKQVHIIESNANLCNQIKYEQ